MTQDILNIAIPVDDYELFGLSLKILSIFDQQSKNDTQIYLALKRFEDRIPPISSNESLSMGELTKIVDKVWKKQNPNLKEDSGNICKIFSSPHFGVSTNIWRNPLGTQKGISCFAPDHLIKRMDFLEQNRNICPKRIEGNKCEFSPDTTCNPYEYPKLLQIEKESSKRYIVNFHNNRTFLP